jgi:hypothetical protein
MRRLKLVSMAESFAVLPAFSKSGACHARLHNGIWFDAVQNLPELS